ncbi:MAG TPA: UvrD-helicase domain-containing protein [Rhodanobacter sp.]
MSSSPHNCAILAAAGSRKTEHIVETALAVTSGRVLITTYTNENQNQIVRRMQEKVGTIPANITVMGWFSFLIAHCIKPYQRARFGKAFLVQGLNFKGKHHKFAKKADRHYFLDNNSDIFRDGVSDLAVALNEATDGAVIRRLEKIYTNIMIDEVQDMAGYDLELLDLLMKSQIALTMVGDPRQHTFSTNDSRKGKKHQGTGLLGWFKERARLCALHERTVSYRCNQMICDFADELYPNMPKTTSSGVAVTGHDGIFYVPESRVSEYLGRFKLVTLLRHDKRAKTLGLAAINFGVAKGSTFDRVLIFPTEPMLAYLNDRDPSKLKAPEKFYVAVTRARFSVAFVIKKPSAVGLPQDADLGW